MHDTYNSSTSAPTDGVRLSSGPVAAVSMDEATRWFVVNTLPMSERRAIANLERQNIGTYLPYVSRAVRNGRVLVNQKRPLFPSYVFVRLETKMLQWRSIDGTYGVRRIVKTSGTPAPMPIGCVEALQDMTNEDGCVSFASKIRKGDAVRFMSGPLHSFIGSLETLDASGRITVLLDLLGRKTIIKAKACEVVPVTSSAVSRDRENVERGRQRTF